MNKRKIVLLSGGRDSLLSAAIIAASTDKPILLAFCNNGHIEGEERIGIAIQALEQRYGEDKIGKLVRFHTGMTLQYLLSKTWHCSVNELSELYPDLQMYQVHCLVCKLSMYVHTIAFCKKNNIGVIIDGMRRSQGFFVDCPEFREIMQELCKANDIELCTPIYDLESDQDRKRMLCDRRLPTKTFEPQCFLGCPILKDLTNKEKSSLLLYLKNEILDSVHEYIQELQFHI